MALETITATCFFNAIGISTLRRCSTFFSSRSPSIRECCKKRYGALNSRSALRTHAFLASSITLIFFFSSSLSLPSANADKSGRKLLLKCTMAEYGHTYTRTIGRIACEGNGWCNADKSILSVWNIDRSWRQWRRQHGNEWYIHSHFHSNCYQSFTVECQWDIRGRRSVWGCQRILWFWTCKTIAFESSTSLFPGTSNRPKYSMSIRRSPSFNRVWGNELHFFHLLYIFFIEIAANSELAAGLVRYKILRRLIFYVTQVATATSAWEAICLYCCKVKAFLSYAWPIHDPSRRTSADFLQPLFRILLNQL